MTDTDDKEPELGRLGRLMSLGLEFVISIVVGMGLGIWMDSLFNSKPMGLLIGLFLGIAAAFRSLFRLSKRLGRK